MKGSRKFYLLKVGAVQAATVVAFLVVWEELVLRRVLNAFLFPTPWRIAVNFLKVAKLQSVYSQVEISLLYTVITYAAAVAVGLFLGLSFGSSSFAKRVSEPFLVLVNSTPKALFLPVFYIALGAEFRYEFWFGFVSAVIPMTLNMMFSVATVPRSLVTAARSMGGSTRSIYTRVVIPSVIPTLLATARIVFSSVFAGILLAQEFVGTTGFGFLIVKFSGTFAIIQMYVVVVIAALISISAFLLLLAAERYSTRWRRL